MDKDKIIHFIFVGIIVTMLAFILSAVSIYKVPLWLLVLVGVIIFGVIYFPFTSTSFDFYKLSIEEKTKKYFLRCLIIDLALAILGLFPLIGCIITGDGECYAGLVSIIIWIYVGILILIEVIVYFIILGFHIFEKFSKKGKYIFILIIFGIGILFIFNGQLIPNTNAFKDPNQFFMESGQCDRINIYDLKDMRNWEVNTDVNIRGCSNIHMFDKNGEPIASYGPPINAFKWCHIDTPDPNYPTTAVTIKTVDCNTREGDEGVVVSRPMYHNAVDIEVMNEYNFSENAYYYDVCKIVLTEIVTELKAECESKKLS